MSSDTVLSCRPSHPTPHLSGAPAAELRWKVFHACMTEYLIGVVTAAEQENQTFMCVDWRTHTLRVLVLTWQGPAEERYTKGEFRLVV